MLVNDVHVSIGCLVSFFTSAILIRILHFYEMSGLYDRTTMPAIHLFSISSLSMVVLRSLCFYDLSGLNYHSSFDTILCRIQWDVWSQFLIQLRWCNELYGTILCQIQWGVWSQCTWRNGVLLFSGTSRSMLLCSVSLNFQCNSGGTSKSTHLWSIRFQFPVQLRRYHEVYVLMGYLVLMSCLPVVVQRGVRSYGVSGLNITFSCGGTMISSFLCASWFQFPGSVVHTISFQTFFVWALLLIIHI